MLKVKFDIEQVTQYLALYTKHSFLFSVRFLVHAHMSTLDEVMVFEYFLMKSNLPSKKL